MKAAAVGINIKGIDKTSGVFARIGRNALSVTKRAAQASAVAVAAIGGSILAGAKQLGKLSDEAQRAHSSVDSLTSLSNALGILGVKGASVDALSQSLAVMYAKTEGVYVGAEGFKKLVAEIGELPTAAQRSEAAIKSFGKAGINYLPIIEASAQNGAAALDQLTAAMPRVSQASAEMGDTLSDTVDVAMQGIKATWLDLVGEILGDYETMGGGAREMGLKFSAYFRYAILSSYREAKNFFGNLAAGMAYVTTSWKDVLSEFNRWLGLGIRQMWANIKGFFNSIAGFISELFSQLWNAVWNGEEFDFSSVTQRFADEWFAAEKEINALASERRSVQFFPDGLFTDADISDLKAQLDESLEAASKAGEAYAKAAITNPVVRAVEDAGEAAAKTIRLAKLDLVTAGSYKAATMSIQADYGRGESKTVGAINKLRQVAEKGVAAMTGVENQLNSLGMV